MTWECPLLPALHRQAPCSVWTQAFLPPLPSLGPPRSCSDFQGRAARRRGNHTLLFRKCSVHFKPASLAGSAEPGSAGMNGVSACGTVPLCLLSTARHPDNWATLRSHVCLLRQQTLASSLRGVDIGPQIWLPSPCALRGVTPSANPELSAQRLQTREREPIRPGQRWSVLVMCLGHGLGPTHHRVLLRVQIHRGLSPFPGSMNSHDSQGASAGAELCKIHIPEERAMNSSFPVYSLVLSQVCSRGYPRSRQEAQQSLSVRRSSVHVFTRGDFEKVREYLDDSAMRGFQLRSRRSKRVL